MMRLLTILPTLLVVLASSGFAPSGQAPPEIRWHTTPDKWKEPRRFQVPFYEHYEDRVVLSREKNDSAFSLTLPSPNKAYWLGVNPDWPQTPDVKCNGTSFQISSVDAELFLFTEREYLVKITIKNHYPNFSITARWINERLVYLEVWWGRILGSSYLLDVENERVIYREMFYDGNQPFMQSRPQKKKKIE